MTAPNQEKEIKFIISQDLTNGEIKIQTEGSRFSFPIATQLFLTALKALKDKIISNLDEADTKKLLQLSFVGNPPAYLKDLSEEATRDEVYLKVEGEMYDLLNIAVSNFLDTEFPRVNARMSLTEQAAAAAGLDQSATPEELIKAENDFMDKNPELAAQTQELKPTNILPFNGANGGPNREQRRKKK